MGKIFKNYLVIWSIFVVIFNVIVFVTPNEVAGMSKFAGAFWVGYIFITLSFLGQLVVAWFSLKDDAKIVFYRWSVLSISYVSLIVMLIAGTVTMAIPNMPIWLGTILCVLVLLFSVIALVQASTAATVVEEIDKKIKVQTFYIKSLTVDADSLLAKATTSEVREEVKKVYEAIRYSDPMSNDLLTSIESEITIRFSALSEAVEKGDLDVVKKATSELLILLNERNKKCRLLK